MGNLNENIIGDGSLRAAISGPGLYEFNTRTGELPEIKKPVKINYTGQIESPRQYIDNRNALIDKQRALVLINRRQLTITFEADKTDCEAATIVGKLIIDKDLQEFKINAEKTFTLRELIKFLRMKRLFFDSSEAHEGFMQKLNDFKFTTKGEFERTKDNKGNYREMVSKEVENKLDDTFKLSMPIFEGCDNRIFEVELCYDVRDLEIEFWFESVELKELLITEADNIINAEKTSIMAADAGYLMLEE